MTALHLAIVVVLAVVASCAALVLTSRRLHDAAAGRRLVLLVLRALSLLCLLVMLADPISSRLASVPAPPRLVVLADRSASMGLKDAPGGLSRFVWAADWLRSGALLRGLPADVAVRRYTFADAAHEANLSLNGAPDGPATDVDAALRAAVQADPAGPPDAIVLLSDGAANRGPDREETVAWLARTRVPVFCVGIGRTERPSDVWLARLDAPRTVKAGTGCTVTVGIASRGLDGKHARVTVSGAGLPTQEQTVSLRAAGRQRVPITLRPSKPGVYRCRAAIGAVAGEWTPSNDERTFFLRVTPGETKLLAIAGRPGTELKFLLRALEPMTEVRVTCLVRKAGQGFAEAASAAGSRRLPTGRALDAFDGVMLEDIPATAFTGAELSGLTAFVSERGGGLAMLGGSDSFGTGGWGSSPIAPALGVRLGPADAYSTVPAKATQTAEARDIAPVADIERHEDFPGWPAMPLLDSLNRTAGVRPGASVLLRAETGEPLLVVQRYGQGRTLCLLTGGTHRWVLSRDATEGSRRGHGAFWRVIAAWLTTPPNRAPVALETDRDVYEVGETARVVVQVSDVGFQPVSSARVTVAARPAGAAPREIALTETAGSPGRYEGGLPLTAPGSWKLSAAAALRGATLGTDAREIAVEPPRLELADAAQDVAFLRSIAGASGGAYLAAEQASHLPELVKLVPHERQTRVHNAWARSPWALAVLMLLVGSDWLLRRWWGVG
jgi:uncharacterized membrane protein